MINEQLQNTPDNDDSDLVLFNDLSAKKMRANDVSACLKMSQHDFLSMLIRGASERLFRPVSRVEFAEFAEVTPKAIYSYFASEGARDYRVLSDEMRIAIIWRLTIKTFPPHTGTAGHGPINKARNWINTIKSRGGNPKFSAGELSERYRSSKTGQLTFTRGEHWPDAYLTDFVDKVKRKQRASSNLYIVNGERMTLSEASRKLGYTTPTGLYVRIRKDDIKPGADISCYKRLKNKYKRRADANKQ